MSKVDKKKSREKRVPTVSTDDMAVSIYNNLLSDFRAVHPNFAPDATTLRLGVPESYRQLGLPDYRSTLVPRFKAYYQLDNLLKKYRFQNENITEAEKELRTYAKYNAFQAKRSTYGKLPYRAFLVIQEARKICRDILGKLDWDEVVANCRFGRNSSVGCNFAEAYLDVKFTSPAAFTSSIGAWQFFKDYLSSDPLLSRVFRGRIACLHEVLPLITVPKKYDIDRTIMPLTLVTLFLSHGIGVTVEGRLSHCPKPEHRLNIRRLQEKHREWIRKYSITKSHATLDMSFGSENITSWLLNMLLPREWYNAVKMTFTRQNRQGKQQCYTESVLPMGNGATFPVETLIFYSLIRAIGNLAKIPGRYSVYGDDVIVPSSCYKFVLAIFDDLGIAVNRDKSFCLESFRESCGADYYCGAAVRPFYIPDGMKCDRKTNPKYVSWLYKCMNGLLARWDPLDIPRTLQSLLMELAICTGGKVLTVPPSFPDGSGVKTKDPYSPPFPGFQCWTLPECRFTHGTRMYKFNFLLEMPRKRIANTAVSYYWDQLRQQQHTKIVLPNIWLERGKDGLCTPIVERQLSDDWKNLVHKDHLRYLSYVTPSNLSYKSRVKWAVWKDKNGVTRRKERVVWTVFTTDKQRSAFVVKTVDGTRHGPSNERIEPFITDWI